MSTEVKPFSAAATFALRVLVNPFTEMRVPPQKVSCIDDPSIQVSVNVTMQGSASVWLTRIFFAIGVIFFLPFRFAFCQQSSNVPTPNGAMIFAERCSTCHGPTGGGISGIETIAGPSLQAEHDYGTVLTAVEVGPSHMPTFSYVLSVPEMRAVARYVTQSIAVIPLTGGNLGEGGELFRMYCAACHRTAVRGGALAFTGINAPALTHKSAPLIAGAIRWGPGPMPSFPAAVLNDQQLASIVDYVKYVQHPPDPGGSPIGYYGPVAEGFIGFIGLFLLVVFSMGIEKGGKG